MDSQTASKIIIGLGGTILGAIIKGIVDYRTKKKDIQRELSNEIISICDRMLRNHINFEFVCLAMEKSNSVLRIEKDEKIYEIHKNLYFQYHKDADDLINQGDSLKAELKRTVKDLSIYWDSELQSRQIISIMSTLVLIRPRRFTYEFNRATTPAKIEYTYNRRSASIQNYVIYKTIGLHLIKIQSILDPKSPSLYMDKEEEKKLKLKLKHYSCDSDCSCKKIQIGY